MRERQQSNIQNVTRHYTNDNNIAISTEETIYTESYKGIHNRKQMFCFSCYHDDVVVMVSKHIYIS